MGLVALGTLVSFASCGRAGGNVAPPNVLLILIDALRPDHLGVYGYSRNTSPVIDDLARGGVVFENATSPASWTKPAVASLFTGLDPLQHRVFTGNNRDTEGRITSDVLIEEHLTLAEVLRSAGYRTGGFVRNAHLRPFLGFGQGFDFYRADLGDATEVTEQFLDWLQQGRTEKFFAYLHLLDVHWPYSPPDPFAKVFEPPEADLEFNERDTWKLLERKARSGDMVISEADIEAMNALYDGEIRYIDAALGQLFASLRARGLYDNTLIVLTADHGEEFLDHRGVSHGQTLYDEMLRVPLIIRGPGLTPRRVRDQVELIDILPTVLSLTGVKAPPGLSGRDLRGLLEGEETRPATVFFADHRPNGSSGRIQQSVRSGRYKLIRTFESSGKRNSEIPLLQGGTWIEVDGTQQEGGSFLATEIELIQERDDLRLFGPMRDYSGSDRNFDLLGARCRLLPDAEVLDQSGGRVDLEKLGEGVWIKARGDTWRDGVLLLHKVELVAVEADPQPEIKAPIQRMLRKGDTPVAMDLAGIRVLIDDETEWEGELPGQPAGRDRHPSTRTLVGVELYDLERDPGELHDLAENDPRRVAEMSRLLSDWERRRGLIERSRKEVELDPSTVEELKALGYID